LVGLDVGNICYPMLLPRNISKIPHLCSRPPLVILIPILSQGRILGTALIHFICSLENGH